MEYKFREEDYNYYFTNFIFSKVPILEHLWAPEMCQRFRQQSSPKACTFEYMPKNKP